MSFGERRMTFIATPLTLTTSWTKL